MERKISESASAPARGNGIAHVYHQFPYFYSDAELMREQLKRIKHDLFCNIVWVGPLQEPGRKKVRRGRRVVSGSQYAMRNDTKFNPKLNLIEEKLKEYTIRT